jgi:membrane carboxypeptidase/penicillin-binding protein PbpC
LYEAALEEGLILPRTLLPDIPVNLGGFAPQNFDRQFYGAVPANEALARSLNVPAVFLLRQYGVPKFYSLLQARGLTTLTRSPETYGLSLILGGAEGRLDEITAAYSALAASVITGSEQPVMAGTEQPVMAGTDRPSLATWYTLDALKEVNRPDELDWRLIRSVRKAAWKTGTSYGFRDAWAVGMTPEYTIGVWAGNAEGQGVPGLTGARTAGPVMFDILNLLPANDAWFEMPDQVGHDGKGQVRDDGKGQVRDDGKGQVRDDGRGVMAGSDRPSAGHRCACLQACWLRPTARPGRCLFRRRGCKARPALTTRAASLYFLRPWSGSTSRIIRNMWGPYREQAPKK